MADTKQTKTVGEHAVAAELARREWAPALTRDGLERTDILAVQLSDQRLMIEVQVKAARGTGPRMSWPLGEKSQQPALTEHEWFVMVAIDPNPANPLRYFVAPRDHVAAAAWISHENWRTDPTAPVGARNATVDRARVTLEVFERYEDRWDLLNGNAFETPVLLPPVYRDYAQELRVSLPPDHRWREELPEW
ncbi:MAG TPA: hypothetical protein VGM70_08205 [Pseudolysinimonas sp.]|jgi:hypothetical protein